MHQRECEQVHHTLITICCDAAYRLNAFLLKGGLYRDNVVKWVGGWGVGVGFVLVVHHWCLSLI